IGLALVAGALSAYFIATSEHSDREELAAASSPGKKPDLAALAKMAARPAAPERAKGEAAPATSPESTASAKPAASTEAKPDTSAEAKPDTSADAKPAAIAEATKPPASAETSREASAPAEPRPPRPGEPAEEASVPDSPPPAPVEDAETNRRPTALITLQVDSLPRGAIVIRQRDGVRLGETPFTYQTEPQKAPVAIILRHKGYRDEVVNLPGNRSAERRIPLTRSDGPDRAPSLKD
ncbi:MAG TPA: hypothetical protein VEL05_00180, partial [Candidatus Acidoferrum sp.]|nr:hypothetical protein [Candidatus Acidoferrum sp.]